MLLDAQVYLAQKKKRMLVSDLLLLVSPLPFVLFVILLILMHSV